MERIAVVTGAGTGVGRAVTLELARAGYTVALAGRRPDPLQETAAEAEGETLVQPTDVADPEAVRALFAEVWSRYGRLDLLFNNAGVMVAGDIGEMEFEEWKAVVDVNLHGMFLCAQEAFRLMRDQDPRGGRIINNGSISAAVPRPRSVSYTATKHAITGLTRSISLDGRPYDIACGQIDIGNAATELTAKMAEGVAQADGSTKVEPRMEAGDVGRAVAYMASLPLSANVQFMTVMATTMPFIGRG